MNSGMLLLGLGGIAAAVYFLTMRGLKPGDRVALVLNPNVRGVVVGVHTEPDGSKWADVLFDSTGHSTVPVTDLVKV